MEFTTILNSQATTLVQALQEHAKIRADKTAFIFLSDNGETETKLTFSELDRKAKSIAASLQQAGLSGSNCLLLYPPGVDYVAAFFGCAYAGVVAVPIYPPRSSRNMMRLQTVLEDASAPAALTIDAIQQKYQADPQFPSTKLISTDMIGLELADEWTDPNLTGDNISFLQYTSGSTGQPKGVMVSHSNLLHNAKMIVEATQSTVDSVYVSWLPLYHDMGLIGNMLTSAIYGSTCVLMSPMDFLQNPLLWLQAVSRYRATTSGGPNFAYELCMRKITDEQKASLDLSSWKTAFNGAEPVRASTLARFSQAFAISGFRQEMHWPCYGLAEGTLLVTGPVHLTGYKTLRISASALEENRIVPTDSDTDVRTFVGCGKTWLDSKVVIVDPETLAICPPDRVGEIWVKSDSVAQGYWNKAEQTEQTFRASCSDTGEGPFMRTGDLGFMMDDDLYVTGRLKDLLVFRGRNHYPQDIEMTVEQSHEAIRPGCSAAFSVEEGDEERLIVVAEIERSFRRSKDDTGKATMREIVTAVRQAIAAGHELNIYALKLIKTNTIPKTSSGKIQRHACKQGYLKNSLDVWGE